jgi:hypothetical protein
MQAKKLTKADKYNLSQGYIFKISNLNLSIKSSNKHITKVYPEVDFTNIEYAVILTQSCDIVHDEVAENNGKKLKKGENPEKFKYRSPKVPHLTFCMLEPIDKFIDRFTSINKSDFVIDLNDYVDGIKKDFDVDIFSKEIALEKTLGQIDKLLQNNHPWAFFISLPPQSDKRYYYVNLTKILPIKMSHYDSVLKLAKYKLSGEFSDKLAWKIANLYGRIGTRDYTDNQMKKISSNIFNIVEQKVFGVSQNFNDLDAKTFKQLKKELNKAKGKPDNADKVASALSKHVLKKKIKIVN